MKKINPNSFITVNVRWKSEKTEQYYNTEITFQLKYIHRLENLTRNNNEGNNYWLWTSRKRTNNNTSPYLKYKIDKPTYLRLKKIVSQIDFDKPDNIIVEQVKEAVKEELKIESNSKSKSAISSLDVMGV